MYNIILYSHLHATASRSIGSIRQNQNPFAYGMPDLDPMYGLREPGVGMIFEPRRPDRLPGYGVYFSFICI